MLDAIIFFIIYAIILIFIIGICIMTYKKTIFKITKTERPKPNFSVQLSAKI